MSERFDGTKNQGIHIDETDTPPSEDTHAETIRINPLLTITPEEADLMYTYLFKYDSDMRPKLKVMRQKLMYESMAQYKQMLIELWDDLSKHHHNKELEIMGEVIVDVLQQKEIKTNILSVLRDSEEVDRIRKLIEGDKEMQKDYDRIKAIQMYKTHKTEFDRKVILDDMANELENSQSNYLFAQYLHFFKKNGLLS